MKSVLLTTVALLTMTCLIAAGPIHDAAEQGDLEQVKSLLQSDPQLLESPAGDGKTPLHKAAYAGHIEVVRFLLEKGASPASRSNQNSTPAHGAAYYGHEDVIALLLEYDAPVDAANSYGYVPLLSASAGGHVEIVKRLIAAGADPNAETNQGANALLNAAASGNAEMFDLLAGAGADMNSADSDGENLLHYAAWGGNVDLLQRLIDHGLEVVSVSNHGVTPLHNAAANCQLAAVKHLVQQGADIHATDNEGQTCLRKAVESTRQGEQPELPALIDYLVSAGLDVNQPDDNGWTPLAPAMWSDNMEVARKLVEAGADPNAHTRDGLSPVKYAVLWEKTDLLRLFIESGAKVDVPRERDGLTALHLAAIGGNADLAEMLLPNVKNIDVKDAQGATPLNYATRYGNKRVADLLKSRGAKKDKVTAETDPTVSLSEFLADKEANLWYLGHCGWAIQTKNHLLVFDYWSRGAHPTEPCLDNGHLNPGEVADLNVELFVTHEHRDHYDSVIFGWEDQIEDLTYIFGFKPEDLGEDQRSGYAGQSYEYVAPRTQRTLDGMTVHAIESNDAGAGFLVEVDGLRIYHAGDHAGWTDWETGPATFKAEIDHLADIVDQVDFAFVNVTGCRHQDTLALQESVQYTLEKLNPKIFVPTHGLNREFVYREFADKITALGINVESICPQFRGDRYHYQGDRML